MPVLRVVSLQKIINNNSVSQTTSLFTFCCCCCSIAHNYLISLYSSPQTGTLVPLCELRIPCVLLQ